MINTYEQSLQSSSHSSIANSQSKKVKKSAKDIKMGIMNSNSNNQSYNYSPSVKKSLIYD